MTEDTTPRLVVDDATGQVDLPHWGITLRTLFGACLASQQDPVPGQVRHYTVRHKGAPIATLNVKQHDDLYD